MPEIGFDEEPISPVSRDDTVTKRNPRMTMRIAPMIRAVKPVPPTYSGLASAMIATSAKLPMSTSFIERSRSVRAIPSRAAAPPRKSFRPSRSPCQIVGSERSGESRAEELDRGNEHEVREDAAGAHDRGDARSDDVADTEQLGGDFRRNGSGGERRAEDFLRSVLPAAERDVQSLVDETDSEAGEDRLRARGLAAELLHLSFCRLGRTRDRLVGCACLQHFGARRSFRILQRAVLLHDERAPQRNHHENAEQSAEDRDEHHARDLEIEAEDENRRHRDADAERDRLT